MTTYGPRYKYQAIIWPKGGGEVLQSTVIPLRPHVEPDTMLAYFEEKYGPAIDSAHTDDDGKRVEIGWVFEAPAGLDLGIDPAGLELVVIPRLTDPESGEDECLFVYQARLKADFLAAMAASDVNVTVITAPQRRPDSDPTSKSGSDS